ncbi:hypothetical protein DWU98_09545 [Dyella monticola]|uniref:Uncharacterized protein n=1 Tax=Dyella monticola TaxID=1927958 RepID=A0A370X1H7_9GAMM|nr:hypothetical protein [Dyella monticola]RDS82264.1 hypothetical protein DWU98_09545 [Dyella monticola]
MNAESAYAIVYEIASLAGHKVKSISPKTHTVQFWPRIEGSEPDLVVDFFDATECQMQRLVVEVKWDARMSGSGQLIKQRESFCRGSYEEHSYHVLLSKNVGDADMREQLVFSGCKAVTWHQLVNRLSLKSAWGDSPATSIWRDRIGLFLSEMGIVPFDSFQTEIGTLKAKAHHFTGAWHVDHWSFLAESMLPLTERMAGYVTSWEIKK